MPVFINKVLLETIVPVRFHIGYDCFHHSVAELIVATDIVWFIKSEMLTVWSFREKPNKILGWIPGRMGRPPLTEAGGSSWSPVHPRSLQPSGGN